MMEVLRGDCDGAACLILYEISTIVIINALLVLLL